MVVTLEDVASKAGVSITTVSRIINGNYNKSTLETRERVLQAIKELDYVPNELARSLKQRKTKLIGIILGNLYNPFWVDVLTGVEAACKKLGYALLICNSDGDDDALAGYIKSLQVRQVDGIITNPITPNREFIKTLTQRGYPIVVLNESIKDADVHVVMMNNVSGSRRAVEHLLKLGRQKIACVSYPTKHMTNRLERIKGYEEAMIHYDRPRKAEVHIVSEEDGAAKAYIKQLMTGRDRPDAIFSTQNLLTLEILEGVKESGLKIPEDVGIVAYDENVWSKHLDPPLTTVNQPAFEMGEVAANMLVELSAMKTRPETRTVILEQGLIIRRSCGANIPKE